jgi:hypothetical protein
MPGQSLLLEAAVVGATLVPVYGVVCKAVDAITGNMTSENPDYKDMPWWVLKIAATGFLYHSLAEAYGMNAWFLHNSVAKRKDERAHTKEMMGRRETRYNYSNYAVPEFPDKDRRTPMGDQWATGSWTTGVGAPVANAVQQFPVQQ